MGRYDPKAVFRAAREPQRLIGEARRIGIKINRILNKPPEGFDIMGSDWDVLVILDGCRLDLFKSQSTLRGQTTAVDSGASYSVEFMKTHFYDHEYHDTVYVSANPYTNNLGSGVFHDIKNIYLSHWDNEVGTVRPEAVADAAVAAAQEYSDKRLIIHFMQPHYPFIGEKGPDWYTGTLHLSGGNDVWTQLQNLRCPVSREAVWDAYAENYRLVENSVRRVDAEILGKTVVTADHGNLFGERLSPIPIKCYGHPYGIYHEALRQVPWHEMPIKQRRKVSADPPHEIDDVDEDVIQDQLRALGYA